jgi:hypothetical protein
VDAEKAFEGYVEGALAAAGIEADEIELAVIGAARKAYLDETNELWTADLKRVEPEIDQDLSRAPRK